MRIEKVTLGFATILVLVIISGLHQPIQYLFSLLHRNDVQVQGLIVPLSLSRAVFRHLQPNTDWWARKKVFIKMLPDLRGGELPNFGPISPTKQRTQPLPEPETMSRNPTPSTFVLLEPKAAMWTAL